MCRPIATRSAMSAIAPSSQKPTHWQRFWQRWKITLNSFRWPEGCYPSSPANQSSLRLRGHAVSFGLSSFCVAFLAEMRRYLRMLLACSLFALLSALYVFSQFASSLERAARRTDGTAQRGDGRQGVGKAAQKSGPGDQHWYNRWASPV